MCIIQGTIHCTALSYLTLLGGNPDCYVSEIELFHTQIIFFINSTES